MQSVPGLEQWGPWWWVFTTEHTPRELLADMQEVCEATFGSDIAVFDSEKSAAEAHSQARARVVDPHDGRYRRVGV